METNTVWLVVLGAVLAMLTTVAVELLKFWFTNRNKTKDYKIVVRLELKSLIPAIDRLIDQYGVSQFFRFTAIDELMLAAQRADRVREQITLIESNAKKEDVLSAISDVFVFCSDLKTLETTAFTTQSPATSENAQPLLPWNADIFRSQRQILAIKSVDLKRKLQDLISYLENR